MHTLQYTKITYYLKGSQEPQTPHLTKGLHRVKELVQSDRDYTK